jgi:hypothetical protein
VGDTAGQTRVAVLPGERLDGDPCGCYEQQADADVQVQAVQRLAKGQGEGGEAKAMIRLSPPIMIHGWVAGWP